MDAIRFNLAHDVRPAPMQPEYNLGMGKQIASTPTLVATAFATGFVLVLASQSSRPERAVAEAITAEQSTYSAPAKATYSTLAKPTYATPVKRTYPTAAAATYSGPPKPSHGIPAAPSYSGRDLDCKDIGGPVRITGPDVHHLDRDGDGIGCE